MSYRRGMSLLEMIVALAITAVLCGVLVSTFGLAARAYPTPSSPPEGAASLRRALSRAARELALASSVDRGSSTRAQFTVADRTSDGAAETLDLSWSGRPGDPLLLAVNSDSVTLLPAVNSFDIQWGLSDVEVAATINVEGPEELLSGFTDSSSSTVSVGLTSGTAQYVRPVFSSDAVSWRITRVVPRVTSVLGTPTLQVALFSEGVNGVVGSLLGSVNSLLSGIVGVGTPSAAISSSSLTPGNGVWLKFAQPLGLGLKMPIETGVADANSRMATIDALGNWTYVEDSSLLFEVYGRVTRATKSIAIEQRVTSVRLTAELASQPPSKVTVAEIMLNRPSAEDINP